MLRQQPALLPAELRFGDVTTSDEIHFLEGVTGLLLSWKVARALQILPAFYPAQIRTDAEKSRSRRSQPRDEPPTDTPATTLSAPAHHAAVAPLHQRSVT